jgi:hypothetical protein
VRCSGMHRPHLLRNTRQLLPAPYPLRLKFEPSLTRSCVAASERVPCVVQRMQWARGWESRKTLDVKMLRNWLTRLQPLWRMMAAASVEHEA